MKDIDVIMAGTPNIDLIVSPYAKFPNPGEEIRVDNIFMQCGGGIAITAIALAKLGVKTLMYGTHHKDLFGDFILKELDKYGVLTKFESANISTGITIALDVDKDRRFITYDGCVNDISPKDIPKDLIKRSKHVHLTNYKGRSVLDEYLSFIDEMHSLDITVSMDVGWDDAGEWDQCIFEITKKLDIFFINDKELMKYTRCDNITDSAKKISKACNHVAIKMGSKGSMLLLNGDVFELKADKVKALDTTGAGDSFNAGYIYGFLNNCSPLKSIKIANVCGSMSVQGYGGYINLPTLEQLEQLLKKVEF